LADPRRGDSPATVRAPANYRSGVAAFEAATDGTLCVRSRRPPRDFAVCVPGVADLTYSRFASVFCDRTHLRSSHSGASLTHIIAAESPYSVPSALS